MRFPLLLLIGVAAAAPAAERKLFISTFDRLRVDGPFRVVVTAGHSPMGTISGDPRQLDGVEVRQEGGTVIVRRNAQRWDEQRRGERRAMDRARLLRRSRDGRQDPARDWEFMQRKMARG